MLIPQFSVRRLLLWMALSAICFLVVSMALRGASWAAALSVSGAFVCLGLGIYAMLFTLSWVCQLTLRRLQGPAAPESPFAHDQLPTQVIPKDSD